MRGGWTPACDCSCRSPHRQKRTSGSGLRTRCRSRRPVVRGGRTAPGRWAQRWTSKPAASGSGSRRAPSPSLPASLCGSAGSGPPWARTPRRCSLWSRSVGSGTGSPWARSALAGRFLTKRSGSRSRPGSAASRPRIWVPDTDSSPACCSSAEFVVCHWTATDSSAESLLAWTGAWTETSVSPCGPSWWRNRRQSSSAGDRIPALTPAERHRRLF